MEYKALGWVFVGFLLLRLFGRYSITHVPIQD